MLKNWCVVILILTGLPQLALAAEKSNAELYRMILSLEKKIDAAVAEADRARAEANSARQEAVRAKAELARLKMGAAETGEPTQVPIPDAPPKPATGWIAAVESVFLRPSRSGLDFAIEDPNNDRPVQGSSQRLEPGYESGWRYSLGYRFASGVDLRLDYATFTTHERSTATVAPGGSLWGTWIHANAIIDDNDVDFAEGAYRFEQRTFDLVAGGRMAVSDALGLRLDAGLRRATIDQDLDADYWQYPAPVLDRYVGVHHENNFSGWGPVLGMELDWQFGGGFSLFGGVTGSLLMGDFNLTYTAEDGQIFHDGTPETVGTRYDIEETVDHHVVPVLEMRAGIAYACPLKNGMTIGARAGYEWQNWFNMVAHARFVDDVDDQLMATDTTDISLDGFFVQGFVDF